MSAIIEAVGVRKRFGKVEALAGVDLSAQSGQVLALLGPNGAGKTTFVRAIATLLKPDSGTLRVAGYDVVRDAAAVRGVMSLAGQSAAVEPAMTGRENVEMIARLVGYSARDARTIGADVLALLGLTDAVDRLARTYSGGMRRRLDLAASLVGEPRLLLLDEPTAGLDPRSRIELWDAIRALVGRGTDVLLTTQYLDEADHLADQIVIIDHGRAIASGTPRDLKARAGHDVIEVHAPAVDGLPAIASAFAALGVEAPVVEPELHRVSVAVDAGIDRLRDALRVLEEQQLVVDDVSLRRPTLDEVFLHLTGAPAGASS
ncbi:MAG TPA: ATP-binding cassette domain-containing protein [Acidimicrobiia bacterium]|nr:ATP-binding cassette domain-containing protein [Acidimicrobiia bacterium]